MCEIIKPFKKCLKVVEDRNVEPFKELPHILGYEIIQKPHQEAARFFQ